MLLEIGFLTICLPLLFLVFIIYWKLILPEKRVYDELRRQGVPGEPFVPLLGQMSEIRNARDQDQLMEYHESLAKKHGPIFLVGYGPLVRLVVHDPDILADVFSRAHAYHYEKPIDYTTVLKPIIGTHNLLISSASEHERARKMLNPAFHFINLQSMVSIMADQTASEILDLIRLSKDGPVDLQKELNKLTLSIIASSAFGQSFETISDAKEIIGQTLPDVLDAVMYRTMRMVNLIPLLARLPFWKKKLVDEGTSRVSRLVDRIIVERKQGRSKSSCAGADLLDILLSSVDEHGNPFTDDEIKEQALTFVLAGHETTGNLMVWAICALMNNEDALNACQKEVDQILSDCHVPSYQHLNQMHVCEAIIFETLRLYPPAPLFTRYCIKEHTVGSLEHRQLKIPVHTTIWLNTYTLHRRPEFWTNPLQFDYKRWLRDPISGLKPKLAHPLCYLPFAAGSRSCIGQNFALLEAKVILSMLVHRCQFSLEPGQNLTPDIRITMRPKYGVRATVQLR